MKRSAPTLILLLSGLVGGCATAVPVIDFYDADAETLRRFPTIEILDDAAIVDGAYRDLGLVKGLYCSRDNASLMIRNARAELLAIDQVKLNAAALDADAISEPRCLQSHDMDLTNNCWGKVVCESNAFAAGDD